MHDEYRAFQTGYLFEGDLKVRDFAEGKYGLHWFKSQYKKDLRYLTAYANLSGKEVPIDINTTVYTVMNFINGEYKTIDEKNKGSHSHYRPQPA